MLKTASTRLSRIAFTRQARSQRATSPGTATARWISSAEAVAMRRFAAGPAAATSTMSRRTLRSRPKTTGTGLAQPKRNEAPLISSKAGRITVPRGSMCFSGLKVTRPWR